MKKFTNVLLVLVMVISMSVTAFGSESENYDSVTSAQDDTSVQTTVSENDDETVTTICDSNKGNVVHTTVVTVEDDSSAVVETIEESTENEESTEDDSIAFTDSDNVNVAPPVVQVVIPETSDEEVPETPETEEPTEEPEVETPEVEIPVVETPVVETPVVETPVVETPREPETNRPRNITRTELDTDDDRPQVTVVKETPEKKVLLQTEEEVVPNTPVKRPLPQTGGTRKNTNNDGMIIAIMMVIAGIAILVMPKMTVKSETISNIQAHDLVSNLFNSNKYGMFNNVITSYYSTKSALRQISINNAVFQR